MYGLKQHKSGGIILTYLEWNTKIYYSKQTNKNPVYTSHLIINFLLYS